MTVEHEGKVLTEVTGHVCKRGEKYAEDEIVNPRRTLTSTVILNSTEIKFLPVKTSKPIEKDKMFEGMRIINSMNVKVPVRMGDVLREDFTESGINLVAGRDVDN
jgi:CxxC motif-containing protein